MVREARAAVATVATFEEACAAERSDSPHHHESWNIFRHRTDELTAQRIELDSASAKKASVARDICIRGRQDSEARANAAKRWFELCTTLDEAYDLTSRSSLLDELGEPLRHDAWLRRRTIEYFTVRNAKNPTVAKDVFDRIVADSPIKKLAEEHWDHLSHEQVRNA